jgi:hypothetical protein
VVYLIQVKDEQTGNKLYDYLKTQNAAHGWWSFSHSYHLDCSSYIFLHPTLYIITILILILISVPH